MMINNNEVSTVTDQSLVFYCHWFSVHVNDLTFNSCSWSQIIVSVTVLEVVSENKLFSLSLYFTDLVLTTIFISRRTNTRRHTCVHSLLDDDVIYHQHVTAPWWPDRLTLVRFKLCFRDTGFSLRAAELLAPGHICTTEAFLWHFKKKMWPRSHVLLQREGRGVSMVSPRHEELVKQILIHNNN